MRYLRFTIPILLLAAFFLPSSSVLANQSVIDSLKTQLQFVKNDTQKVLLQCELAFWYNRSSGEDPREMLAEALETSKKTNFKKGMALAWVQLGVFEARNGAFDAAENHYLRAIKVRKELRDYAGISSILGNLGALKKRQGDYLSAQDYNQYALALYRHLGDSASVARMSSQLCILHRTLGNYTISLEYGFLSLGIHTHQSPQDSAEIGKAYAVVGMTFEYMGENERADSVYHIAKECFEHSHNIRELANTLNNLGNVQEFNADYAAALDYYQQCHALRKTMIDTLETAKVIQNIARIHIRTRAFDNANAELQEALNLLAGTEDSLQIALVKVDLAEVSIWEGRPQKAIDLLLQLRPLLDTMAEPSLRIYCRELLSLAHAGIQNWDASLQWNIAALQLRQPLEKRMLGAVYLYDQYQYAERARERSEARQKITEGDLKFQKERSQRLLAIAVGLFILLILIVFLALQRIQLLKNKRHAVEHKYRLEMKEREVERLEQDKKVQFLQISLEVEDRERSRIAHDLHDRVGAQIGAFKHLFGQLRDDFAAASPTFSTSFERLNAELEALMADVRAVSHDLESPTLKAFGLVAALNGFKDMFAKSPDLDFELDVHGLEERLPRKTEQHIYLILKELFSNALNRGKASQFSIQLLKTQNQLTVIVEDNGIGFDPKAAGESAGLGLQSIENRVQYMHGTLIIDSAIGRGTIVTIEIPLLQEVK